MFVVIQDGVKVQILIPVKEYIPAHTFHLCVDRFIKIGWHFGHKELSLDTTHTIFRLISCIDIVLDRTVVTYILISSHATLHSHMQQLTNKDPHELSTSDNIYYP